MQNTSRIQTIPTTLIKNFFVAGVSQATLINRFKSEKGDSAYNIPPEVLFHLSDSEERIRKYLDFVYPQKVTVEFTAQTPRFFTFMMTDAEGFITFFHVLTFYEEVNEAEIQREDFDIIEKIWQKRQEKESNKNKEKKQAAQSKNSVEQPIVRANTAMFQKQKEELMRRATQRNTSRQVLNVAHFNNNNDRVVLTEQNKFDECDSEPNEKKQAQKQIPKSKQIEMRSRCKKEDTKMKMAIQDFQHVLDKKCRKYRNAPSRKGSDNNESALNVVADIVSSSGKTTTKSLHRTRPSALAGKDNRHMQQSMLQSSTKNPFVPLMDPNTTLISNASQANYVSQLSKMPNNVSIDDNYDMFHEEPLPVDSINELQQQHRKQMEGFFEKNNPNATSDIHDIKLGTNLNLGIKNQSESDVLSDSNFDEELYKKKRYVPVSLVLETETEYHDTFKQILLALFDMIRVPPEQHNIASPNAATDIKIDVNNKKNEIIVENRNIAFADLIAHVAFLKSIPAPPFNSIYNIQMLPIVPNNGPMPNHHLGLHTFTIKEGPFNEIPNRSTSPIKILFDVLDVRSILYCWKALVFDKNLVLVSSQYSLQFNVAEGLKQLLFPMTWQNSYVMPNSERLLDYLDGTMTQIHGSHPTVAGFDYFAGMENNDFAFAVCDIDASFTNLIELPKLPNEHMYIRILNTLKNSKIVSYDNAYPSHSSKYPNEHSIVTSSADQSAGMHSSHEEFVSQIRETFFTILKPYFENIDQYFTNDKKLKVDKANFYNSFLVEDYISHFQEFGDEQHLFAEALVKSSQFIHFCDDYFTDISQGGSGELTNFKMFKAILAGRFEQQNQDDLPDECDRQTDSRDQTFQNLEIKRLQTLMKKQSKQTRPKWPDNQPVIFNFRMPSDAQKAMLFERIHYVIERHIQNKEQDVTRGTNKHIIECKGEFKHAEIIAEIRRAFFSGLSRCKNSLGLVGSGGSIEPGQSKSASIRKKRAMDQASNNSPSKMIIAVDNLDPPTIMRQNSLDEESSIGVYEVDRGTTSSMQLIMDERKIFNNASVLQPAPLPNQNPILPSKQYTKQKTQHDVTQFEEFGFEQSMLSIPGGAGANNFFYDQEYRRVRMCTKKISRLMYGRNGLIKFMRQIFAFFDEDDLAQTINYYFAMREQVEQMENHEKHIKAQVKQMKENKPISEESNEEEEKKESSSMAFGSTKEVQKLVAPENPMTQSHSSLGKKVVYSSQQSQISHCNGVFKNDKDWFVVSEWFGTNNSYCQMLRRTAQYVSFKIKMFEGFECHEDGHSLIWVELFKMYPKHSSTKDSSMNIFPVSTLVNIWVDLTYSQQEEWFSRYGQRQTTQQIQLITSLYNKTHLQSTTGSTGVSEGSRGSSDTTSSTKSFKNDEYLFHNASITKTWVDKKNEVKALKEKEAKQAALIASLANSQSELHTPGSEQVKSKSLVEQYQFSNTVKQKMLDKKSKKTDTGKDSNKPNIISRFFGSSNNEKSKDKKKQSEIDQNSMNKSNMMMQHHAKSTHNVMAPIFPEDLKSKVTPSKEGISPSKTFDILIAPSMSSFNHSLTEEVKSDSIIQRSKSKHISQKDVGISFDLRKTDSKEEKQEGTLSNPNQMAEHCVKKINLFWLENSKHVEGRGRFKESQLTAVTEKLATFDKYLEYLTQKPLFEPTLDEQQALNMSKDEASDVLKQCFFLNIFNFMVLYQLALLMLSNQDTVQKLQNYNMWQSFLDNCSIIINHQRLKAYCIMHSILRGKMNLPQHLSQFLLKNGMPESINDREAMTMTANCNLKDFLITRPDPLLSFGISLPLKALPSYTRRFYPKTLQSQLQGIAAEYLSNNIVVRDDYNLIILPKFVKWFKRDFIKSDNENEDGHVQLLKCLSDIIQYDKRQTNPLVPVLIRIDDKHDELLVIFSSFCWQFKIPDFTSRFREKVTGPDVPEFILL